MRLLHTSDWHVGKQIRGRSRQDEHRAVLAEILHAIGPEGADLVISDMAPNMSGVSSLDQPRAIYLGEV